jgi:hypothetical protein
MKTGFARQQAKASGLELQVAAEHAEVIRVREPIIQKMLENLAGELALKEPEAAASRARLHGFSICATGPVPQKLPALAIALLRNPPKNPTPPPINTPAYFTVGREKTAFIAWKKSLETDANARLNLN